MYHKDGDKDLGGHKDVHSALCELERKSRRDKCHAQEELWDDLPCELTIEHPEKMSWARCEDALEHALRCGCPCNIAESICECIKFAIAENNLEAIELICPVLSVTPAPATAVAIK